MAKFISVCSNQILTVKPGRVQVQDGIPIPVPGEHIRFDAGKFETTNKDQIAFLRKHPLFGSRIFEEKAEKQDKQAGNADKPESDTPPAE